MSKGKRLLYISLVVLCSLLGILFVKTGAYADSDSDDFIGVRTVKNDGVYIYLRGVAKSDNVQVQISNKEIASEVEMRDISELEQPVITIVLVDNSKSIEGSSGIPNRPREIINALIDNHMPGERFVVSTFSQTVNNMEEPTDEYDRWREYANSYPYVEQDTFLTDVLIELLKHYNSSSDGSLVRVIIIADGADHNDDKIAEQLNDLLTGGNVVVHTIGIETFESNLGGLFYYSTLAHGESINASKEKDIDAIISTLDKDYNSSVVRFVPTEAVQDGSKKELLVTVDGVEYRGAAIMPLGLIEPKEEVVEEVEEPEEEPEEVIEEEEEKEVEEYQEIPLIVWYAIGGIVAAGVLFVIIYISIKSSKIRKANRRNKIQPSVNEESEIRNTVMLGGGMGIDQTGAATNSVNNRKATKGQDAQTGGVKKVAKSRDNQASSVSPRQDTAYAGAQEATSVQARQAAYLAQARQATPVRPQVEEVVSQPVEESAPNMGPDTDMLNASEEGILLTLIDRADGTEYGVEMTDKLRIGRMNCDIDLDDKRISRSHCEFSCRPDGLWLKDLGSRNGTKYNGYPVEGEIQLVSNGILEIGEHSFDVIIG